MPSLPSLSTLHTVRERQSTNQDRIYSATDKRATETLYASACLALGDIHRRDNSVSFRVCSIRLNAKSLAQAKAWESAITADLNAGKEPDLEAIRRTRPVDERNGGKTLAEVFAVVASHKWAGKKAAKSMTALASQVEALLGPDTPIDDITVSDVDGMVAACRDDGNSNGTINRKIATLCVAIKFAIRRGWRTKALYLDRLDEPAGRSSQLSPDDELRLLVATRHFGYLDEAELFAVLIDTGFRANEALSLEWSSIRAGLITIEGRKAKNGKTRAIPMTDRVAAIFASRRSLSSPFPFDYGQARRAWERVRAHLGKAKDKEWVMHTLRHTCASRLVQRGAPLKVVQEWMGHKTLSMTERYSHLDPANFSAAVALLNPAPTPQPAAT